MIRRKRNKRKLNADINVVPYIDVMMVLLVIFMVTAPMLTQGVSVELPQASAEPVDAQDQEPMIVTVDKEGLYYINIGGEETESISREEVASRVQKVMSVNPKQLLLQEDPYRRIPRHIQAEMIDLKALSNQENLQKEFQAEQKLKAEQEKKREKIAEEHQQALKREELEQQRQAEKIKQEAETQKKEAAEAQKKAQLEKQRKAADDKKLAKLKEQQVIEHARKIAAEKELKKKQDIEEKKKKEEAQKLANAKKVEAEKKRKAEDARKKADDEKKRKNQELARKEAELNAELVVEVTQGVDAPTPVAVVPFGWDGEVLSEDIAKIVSDDLGRSGFFNMMNRESMLSTPRSRDQVFFRDWRISGSDYLVIGRLQPAANGQITATIELYDVLKEQLVWSETVNGNS
ncbi:unnamed protein product, partial [Cyprideis torosa]